MNRHSVFFAMAVLVWMMAAMVAPAPAQQPITPPSPILVNSPIVTINNSAGDQTDPLVDKDLVSYTDLADSSIHYYRFSTGVDSPIPRAVSDLDTLSTSTAIASASAVKPGPIPSKAFSM